MKKCLNCETLFTFVLNKKYCGNWKDKKGCGYQSNLKNRSRIRKELNKRPCIKCGLILVSRKYCGSHLDKTGCAWKIRQDKKHEIQLLYYTQNKKRILETCRKWTIKNRDKKAHYDRIRRYQKLSSGKHTFDEWNNIKKAFNFSCAKCGVSENESKLTEDHKVPLSKKGLNTIDNIQPLCNPCNASKHARIMFAVCDIFTRKISLVQR